MSIRDRAPVECGRCAAVYSATRVESANPTRHPPFLAQLLDRSFLRSECPVCGHTQWNESAMLWTDLPGRLCACVRPPAERRNWRALEVEARAVLGGVFTGEGPPMVQAFGPQVHIRVVFGLEELREKVICRLHHLDDRVVEVLKLPLVDTERGEGPTLEAADEHGLTLVRAGERIEVSGGEYVAAARSGWEDEYPGLAMGNWVHWGRAAV